MKKERQMVRQVEYAKKKGLFASQVTRLINDGKLFCDENRLVDLNQVLPPKGKGGRPRGSKNKKDLNK